MIQGVLHDAGVAYHTRVVLVVVPGGVVRGKGGYVDGIMKTLSWKGERVITRSSCRGSASCRGCESCRAHGVWISTSVVRRDGT